MSDIPLVKSMLEWKLGIERPSLEYAAKATSRQPIFAVLKYDKKTFNIHKSLDKRDKMQTISIHVNPINFIIPWSAQ
jgi:hypothetical protein